MQDRMKKLLKHPLLLIIDMQNVYSKGQKWECSNFERALENTQKLLEHRTDEEVMFTKFIASEHPEGIWADYNEENAEVNQDAWSNEIVEGLAGYAKKYQVVEKSTYSSLVNDAVKESAYASTCVVVTGVVAECCVLATVMNLIDAGHYVIYLKDAVAGADDETEAAVLKVLEGLVPLHLSVMNTEEYMNQTGMGLVAQNTQIKEYRFYGWETADVAPIHDEYKKIKNPRHLYDLLSEIWCADTCAPRMRHNWTKENMTLGQCSITAFLTQDIFGGKVYGILREGGNYHCYNVIGDCKFDLTSEQFERRNEPKSEAAHEFGDRRDEEQIAQSEDEILSYENNPEQFREVHFTKEEKRLRYEYLKAELQKKLALL